MISGGGYDAIRSRPVHVARNADTYVCQSRHAAEPALAEMMQMLAGINSAHARFVETRPIAKLAKSLLLPA